MRPERVGLKMHIFLFSLLSLLISSTAVDTISATQSLKDGKTIVSADGMFELGFFSPGSSSNRYVGIWYKKVSAGTVVWVANRDIPLNDSSGELMVTEQGVLVLLNSTNGIIWSSHASRLLATSPVAQLLDTGNLVVREGNDDEPENILWQSFDYPGDTFLPGMKYGIDLVTGLNRVLTSWKSVHDPSAGNYTNELDPRGVPQFFLLKNSVEKFRAGPWNGLRFSGMPNLKPNPLYTYEFVLNEKEIYYKYELINSSVVTRMELNPSGELSRLTWIDRSQSWNVYLTTMMDNCDRYAICGAYGSCNINNSPPCKCPTGFEPLFPQDWTADWSHGCVRKVPLDCQEGEDFLMYSGIKLPDTRYSWYNKTMDLGECKMVCLRDCSCTAYASLDIREGGIGCILWFSDLIDMREYDENGQDIYIRMAASEIEAYRTSKGKKWIRKIVIPVLSTGLVLLGLCIIFLVFRRRKKPKREGTMMPDPEEDCTDKRDKEEDLELPLYDFATIASATGNFSLVNKLGQGGFGPVYKGILADGQEIAVKRLSKSSRQGLGEFMTEVKCIAKLQHRNLVKLLGCCIQEQERMLIYEYLPNKSLDSFIFDIKQSTSLDWPKRFKIVTGIARGLLYLHQDSILRIIHRDLKASNILLDCDMNPKISDFGMARTFRGDETGVNTSRVVGTYGYMSPEYQIDGFFSVKSDVFGFGVLVLEIVSGKRNRGFSHPDHKLNLLGHAWRLHREERPFELVDDLVRESCKFPEVLRSIHVGLLCVQQRPEDRPNMSTVVLMLSSEMTLPQPKEPGFFTERNLLDSDSSSVKLEISTNELSVTLLEPR